MVEEDKEDDEKTQQEMEKVDEVLGQALYTERVDGKVYIYGHQAEQKIFVVQFS